MQNSICICIELRRKPRLTQAAAKSFDTLCQQEKIDKF